MLKSVLARLWGGRSRAKPTWLEHAVGLQHDGRHEEVALLCRERLRRAPSDLNAHQLLAAALFAQGRTRDGVSALQAAAALAPGEIALHLQLARAHAALGELDTATEELRKAHAVAPAHVAATTELVALLKASGRYDEAEDALRRTLAAHPHDAGLTHALALVLFEQGRVGECHDALRTARAADPHNPAVHSDLCRALNYLPRIAPERAFEEHRAWAAAHAETLTAAAPALGNDRDPHRRLRVGYVSPYFRKHAVTFFLESVIAAHDRAGFEIVLYADVARPDAYSERLKSYGAKWRDIVGLSDEALAEAVRADGVDILVDLSGHTPGNRLLAFARRAAPVQVTWNGYPNTTGLSAMDYRVTDSRCDPPGLTERFHSEQLARLPHVLMSWHPPDDAPEPGPPRTQRSGPVTFGSFNSCFKVNEDVIAIWSRVLAAVPDSRLTLFTVPPGRAEQRIVEGFAAHGIGGHRLRTVPRLSHERFLEAHREIDIALDTYPFHGTTTTCFTLWMGVPVIVLTGDTAASRVGCSLLSSVGLGRFAASEPHEYVRLAVDLARDPAQLAELRRDLRSQMRGSPLCDGAACARALEHAYREMWRRWCAAQAC